MSATEQHLLWILSQPRFYIALAFLAAAVAVWLYSFRQAFIRRHRPFLFGLVFVVYSAALVGYAVTALSQFRYFTSLG